jgi:hypothetical protein
MLVLHTSTGPVSDDSNDHASALCWRQWWWCTHHRRYSRLVMLSRLLRSVSPAPPRCRWGCCPTDSHLVLSDGPTLDVQRARACEHGHPAPSTTTASSCPRACMGCDISPPRAAGALTSLLSDTATPYQGLMAQRLPRIGGVRMRAPWSIWEERAPRFDPIVCLPACGRLAAPSPWRPPSAAPRARLV